jgi:hypothetical protein
MNYAACRWRQLETSAPWAEPAAGADGMNISRSSKRRWAAAQRRRSAAQVLNMSRILMVALLLTPCISASARAADQVPYTVDEVDVPSAEAKGQRCNGWSGEFAPKMVRIHLADVDTPIDLARTAVFGGPEADPEQLGIDRDTITVEALAPGTNLLWIRWRSLPDRGSGHVSFEGNILALRDNHAVKVLFRNSFTSFIRSGYAFSSAAGLAIRYEAKSSTIILERTDRMEETNAKGVTSTTEVRMICRYRIDDRRLVFMGGDEYMKVDHAGVLPQTLATRKDLSLKQLLRLNPARDPKRPWSGEIHVADEVKPFSDNHGDCLCEENCSD